MIPVRISSCGSNACEYHCNYVSSFAQQIFVPFFSSFPSDSFTKCIRHCLFPPLTTFNGNQAVHKIKSILQIPTHVKFSDFLFSSGWSWVIFSMICTYFTAILLFATLLSFGGKYFPPTFFFLFLAAPISPIFLAGIAPVFDYGPNNRCAEPADILSLNTT